MPDQFLQQPLPGAPPPPASEEALKSRRKMRWIIGTGFGSVALLGILIMAPITIRSAPRAPILEAVSNARQLGIALFEFQTEYGKFPAGSTAAAVKEATDTTLTLPDQTSNDLFAQLFASGITQSENIFHAAAKFMRRPDNVFTTDATVLSHGECAFAYIVEVDPKGIPTTPIVFGPVIPGTTDLDRSSCGGQAIVLASDNSVRRYPISPTGKIIIDGLDFLDPRQPYWHGKAPDVRGPK